MRILNIGSLNIDHVYSVDHAVKPGETIASRALNDFCGGKGFNQSVALARAGAQVFHAGKVGADGDMLIAYMKDSGIDATHTMLDERYPTGHAIIQVEPSGQNCIIVHGGANAAISEADADGMLRDFGAGDVLLMQNEVNILPYAIRRAKEKGMLIVLNPSPIGDLAVSDVLSCVDIFVLNEIEGYQITGERDGEVICAALIERFPGCRVMLTLGKDGCVYADGERIFRQGIFRVKPVDTTAAGDTFVGYFLAGLGRGEDMATILRTASKASAIAVGRAGAAPSIPSRREVEESDLPEA